MNRLEQWLHQVSHHYVLIAIAVLLFFFIKVVIGYLTYRHYDQQLKDVDHKLNLLLDQIRNKPDS